MAGILEGFGNFSGFSNLVIYLVWFVIFVIAGIVLTMFIILVLVTKDQKKIIELNLVNKKIRIFSGREKVTKSGIKNFFARKIGRFIPVVQEKYKWTRKNKEYIILVKDNNGLEHTLSIPNLKQIKKWYAVQYGLNLKDPDILKQVKQKQKNYEDIKNVYALPNPHESLDWLGNQCIEADQEYKYKNFWQSPAFVWVGTLFVCMITFAITIILGKRL